MKALVIYYSEYGNTEELARAIAHQLGDTGWSRLVAVDEFEMPDLLGIDLLVVGAPTQMHGISPAMRNFLDGLPDGCLHNIVATAFDTRLSGIKLLTGSAATGIAKRLEKKGAYLVAAPESFIVSGREGPLAVGEGERAIQWAEGLRAEVKDRVLA
jgi:flavodoxin